MRHAIVRWSHASHFKGYTMKTLLLFSLFFSSYLLSSEPGQQAQHPEAIGIARASEGESTLQVIFPGTGTKPIYIPLGTEPGQAGRPVVIGVAPMGPHEETHEVFPGR